MPLSPTLSSSREKEIEQIEHLEQLAKINGLRRSIAVEHGAAGLEQQRCFCTFCMITALAAAPNFAPPCQRGGTKAS
jgi:hypothetical protein